MTAGPTKRPPRGWRGDEALVLDVRDGDGAACEVCAGALPDGAAYRIAHIDGGRRSYAYGCSRPHALLIIDGEIAGIERAA